MKWVIMGLIVFVVGVMMYLLVGTVFGWHGLFITMPLAALVGYTTGRLFAKQGVKE